jgi:hypothetical protein
MRPIHRRVSFVAVLGLLLATIIGVTSPNPAAAQLPSTDLAILRITGPQQVKAGKVVTFKIVATNLGPATSQLDVAVTSAGGLELNFLQCDLGISADGPFCEYSNVAPKAKRTTLAIATIQSGAGTTGSLSACTLNEGQTEDPTPGNDCATFVVGITHG